MHEAQAYKLALVDLSRAVALDPRSHSSLFLRGSCQSKLGNYELALQDYDLAEENGFEDLFALYMSRGSVLMLCGDNVRAERDYRLALNLIGPYTIPSAKEAEEEKERLEREAAAAEAAAEASASASAAAAAAKKSRTKTKIDKKALADAVSDVSALIL